VKNQGDPAKEVFREEKEIGRRNGKPFKNRLGLSHGWALLRATAELRYLKGRVERR